MFIILCLINQNSHKNSLYYHLFPIPLLNFVINLTLCLPTKKNLYKTQMIDVEEINKKKEL